MTSCERGGRSNLPAREVRTSGQTSSSRVTIWAFSRTASKVFASEKSINFSCTRLSASSVPLFSHKIHADSPRHFSIPCMTGSRPGAFQCGPAVLEQIDSSYISAASRSEEALFKSLFTYQSNTALTASVGFGPHLVDWSRQSMIGTFQYTHARQDNNALEIYNSLINRKRPLIH